MKNNIGYLFSITLQVMEIKSEVGITNLVFISYIRLNLHFLIFN